MMYPCCIKIHCITCLIFSSVRSLNPIEETEVYPPCTAERTEVLSDVAYRDEFRTREHEGLSCSLVACGKL
jgi:hypothetical protein